MDLNQAPCSTKFSFHVIATNTSEHETGNTGLVIVIALAAAAAAVFKKTVPQWL